MEIYLFHFTLCKLCSEHVFNSKPPLAYSLRLDQITYKNVDPAHCAEPNPSTIYVFSGTPPPQFFQT